MGRLSIYSVRPEFLEKIDLSESAIDVLLAGEVGSVVVDQVLLLSFPEIILASDIQHQCSDYWMCQNNHLYLICRHHF